jgi:hypothetical protein
MEAGVDGLLRDKTRKPGKAPVPEPVVVQLLARTLGPPPGETAHWTSRAIAAAMGLAVSTVQKIWHAYGLAPHRLRIFKLSRDPQFVDKLRDVVGLYVDPPAHSLVRSISSRPRPLGLTRSKGSLPNSPAAASNAMSFIPWSRCIHWPVTVPSSTLRAANRVVVRCRM